MEVNYQKFTQSKQEPLRLSLALEGFFAEEGVLAEEREAYGKYLRQRIRPAVERLMKAGAVERIAYLEEQGWFGARELEEFIRTAAARGYAGVLVWLLQLKAEKYGFEDRDFSL